MVFFKNIEQVNLVQVNDPQANGVFMAVLTPEKGSFVMRYFKVMPGGNTPHHSHPWEHQVFVLEGEGVAVIEDVEVKLSKGTFIFVEPNKRHQFF